MFDPDLYRDAAEVERWKERDPITTFVARLVAEGAITDEEIEAMWTAARSETEAAVAAADAAPEELVDTLLDHVTRPCVAPVVPRARASGSHLEISVPGDPGPGDPVPRDPGAGGRDELDEVWP
jgi:hypothetical protein